MRKLKFSGPEFEKYLRNKYNSKEDLKPGGRLSKLLGAARQSDYTTTLPDEGYENNVMQNNKQGFTDEQNRALVGRALSISDGKDGKFILNGIFDKASKGKPKEDAMNKVFEDYEKKISTGTD